MRGNRRPQRHFNGRSGIRQAFVADIAADITSDRGSKPLEEVGQVGAQAAQWEDEDRVSEDVQFVFGDGPSPLHCDAWPNFHYGQVVHFHILQTKQQSKQWLGNWQPGPIEAKVQASRSRMLVLAFWSHLHQPCTQGATQWTPNTSWMPGTSSRRFSSKKAIDGSWDWWLH